MSARSRLAALAGRLAASITAPPSTASASSASSCSSAFTASTAASTSYGPLAATLLLNQARSFANSGIRVPVNRNQVRIWFEFFLWREGTLIFDLAQREEAKLIEEGEATQISVAISFSAADLSFSSFSTPTSLSPSFDPPAPPLLLSETPTHQKLNNRSTAPSATSTVSARPTTCSPRGGPTACSRARQLNASSRRRRRRGGSRRGGSRRTCGG